MFHINSRMNEIAKVIVFNYSMCSLFFVFRNLNLILLPNFISLMTSIVILNIVSSPICASVWTLVLNSTCHV